MLSNSQICLFDTCYSNIANMCYFDIPRSNFATAREVYNHKQKDDFAILKGLPVRV